MVRAVLFDLDGTLVDTAPDLGDTINAMLARRGRLALSETAIRAQASHGSQALIRLAFGVAEDDSVFPELRREFLEHYSAHLADRSSLFSGMDQLLAILEDHAIAWGVVTNKPTRYTEPLLERLGLLKRAACVVSGDTCVRSKPDPEPMWHACRMIGLAPERCLYVGDAERDIEAARAAHMPAIVALYGYIAEADQTTAWGGNGFIRYPLELLDYLNLRS